MKLSQGVEWGLHCVVLLARLPADTVVRRADLADYHGLAEPVLAKHLHSLTRAGLLHAAPGPKGGYRLGRPAADITVLDVVEAIDGTSQLFVCTEIRQRGSGALSPEQCARPCLINAAMGEAERAWRDSLRAVTIAGLAARIPTPVTTTESA
ncbi:RrF2 family transcriptional regulator [Streptosporangium sandarakinum]|uniref:RrF2 family transcriptional regulator n=1 Tax=Streptosporangium sandarakinum TaxID=1260955 RepID=UPI0033A6E866